MTTSPLPDHVTLGAYRVLAQNWCRESVAEPGKAAVLSISPLSRPPVSFVDEVAVVDLAGRVLLEKRVSRQDPCIGLKDVPSAAGPAGAPGWPEVRADLERVLDGRTVVAWKTSTAWAALAGEIVWEACADDHDDPDTQGWLDTWTWIDLQDVYGLYQGVPDAGQRAALVMPGATGRAAADGKTMVELICLMAAQAL